MGKNMNSEHEDVQGDSWHRAEPSPNDIYYRPHYGGAPHTTVFSLWWILRVVRRNWIYIGVAAALGVGLAVFKVQHTPKQYMASSMIEMSVRRPRITSGEEAVLTDRFASMDSTQVFNTRLQKFRGQRMMTMARQILLKKGIKDPLALSPANFSMVKESFLVQISCSNGNPTNAALSANAFAEAAVQIMEEDNREASEGAVEWLRLQAVAQKQELERADQTLASFRSEHQLDFLQSQITAVRESLNGLNRGLSSLQSETVVKRELLAVLSEGKVPQELANAIDVRDQAEALRASHSRLELLLTKYRPQHPAVLAEQRQVEVLDAAYNSVLEKHQLALQDTIRVLERQDAALQRQIELTQRAAADKEVSLVELSSRQGALQRELQSADMSYSGVLRRMEEARLSADEKTTAVQIARLAEPPMVPFYPNPKRTAASGFIFGGFLGLLLAFAKDWLADRVTSTEDVEDGLGLPALGIFGRMQVKERAKLALAVLNNEPVAFTEAIAGLRTNIVMGGDGTDSVRSILISSAGVECGKTITACNLAMMFALTGERTLIVDFDFRRPRIGRLLTKAGSKEKSLAHALLAGKHDSDSFAALVQKGPHENLDVMASTSDRHLRPAYLLGHSSIKSLIEWAQDHYERVIIDSPPHGLLSDAANLASYVSGVIIVCRHDKSRKHAIARMIRSLEHVNATLLGAVINCVPQGKFSSYDYYHGGYDLKDYDSLQAMGVDEDGDEEKLK